jgi:hypothetical protein
MNKIQTPTNPLKIDRTRLYSPANYAKKIGKSEKTVRRMMADGRVRIQTIDGRKFIYHV